MLDVPSVLMLNCVGSYFYSIINHLTQNKKGGYDALLYLSLGKLTYHNLSIEDTFEKYGNNPWGYQPVNISNSKGEPLEINDAFFNYLAVNHNVNVQCLDMKYNDLLSCLKYTDNETRFVICNVDEFFMPYSQFYQKSHNKHFVLIKKIMFESSSLELIDSEKRHTYKLTFNEIEQAVYNSVYNRKLIYQVDGRNYVNKINKKMAITKIDIQYLQELIKEVKTKLEVTGNNEYFFEGYYFTILSKIIPYYQLVTCLLENSQCENYKFYNALVREWKNITNYMRLKIYKKQNNYGKFIKMLDSIYSKESSSNNY